MEVGTIQAEVRKPEGKHGNERLRSRGLLPAIVYGHNEAPEMISLSRHDTELALSGKLHVVKVMLDGKEHQFLLKEVQYDHLHLKPVHVDLMRVDVSERVQVKVPLEIRGTPKGVTEGGTLVTVLAEVEVDCLVLQIPESMRVRVEHLGLNESVKVKDIEAPAEVKVLNNPDDVVAIVHPPRVEEVAAVAAVEPAEGAAEPEIIAKGKEETEGEAGE